MFVISAGYKRGRFEQYADDYDEILLGLTRHDRRTMNIRKYKL